jgi:hypothetical protein
LELLVEKQRLGAQFNYGCYARIRCLDENTMDLMVKTGCKCVFLGVESGSKRILATLKKGIKTGDAEKVVKALIERNIIPLCSLINGFPDETESEWHETLDYCATLAWAGAIVNISPLRLEPGSALAKQTGYHNLTLLVESEYFKDLTAAGLNPRTIDPHIGFYCYTLNNVNYDMNKALRLNSIFMQALEQIPLTFHLAVRLLEIRPFQLVKKLEELITLADNWVSFQVEESLQLLFDEPALLISYPSWLKTLVKYELNRFLNRPISEQVHIGGAALTHFYRRLCKAPYTLENYIKLPLEP